MSMGYVVEDEFLHAGLVCRVIFFSSGYRSGFVGVGQNHPLFGVSYDDTLDGMDASDLNHEPNNVMEAIKHMTSPNDPITLSEYFCCHNGLDYSDYWNGGRDIGNPPTWWFSFTCNSPEDRIDIEAMEEYFPQCTEEIEAAKNVTELLNFLSRNMDTLNPEVRSREFVRNEVCSLAEQIQTYATTIQVALGKICTPKNLGADLSEDNYSGLDALISAIRDSLPDELKGIIQDVADREILESEREKLENITPFRRIIKPRRKKQHREDTGTKEEKEAIIYNFIGRN